MAAYRAEMLSAPNCTMRLGDPVFARRHPAAAEFRGRVVGRTFGNPIYDVETADGKLITGLTLVRLDEDGLRAMVRAEAMAMAGGDAE